MFFPGYRIGHRKLFRFPAIAFLLFAWVHSHAETVSDTAPAETRGLPAHFIRVSDRVCCGARPESPGHYAALKTLGAKIVVSVDGIRPDAETARGFGLRCIHIPIGYDGISPRASKDLAEVVRQTSGLIFIHCHHGRHRGPAAAAVTAIAAGQFNRVEAMELLKNAGTGRQFKGLWRDVATYQRTTHPGPPSILLEKSDTRLLVQAMSQVAQADERLQQHQKRNWRPVSEGLATLDQTPAEAAALLEQGFRESLRSLDSVSEPALAVAMQNSWNLARQLQRAIAEQDHSTADEVFRPLRAACVQCHQEYRN